MITKIDSNEQIHTSLALTGGWERENLAAPGEGFLISRKAIGELIIELDDGNFAMIGLTEHYATDLAYYGLKGYKKGDKILELDGLDIYSWRPGTPQRLDSDGMSMDNVSKWSIEKTEQFLRRIRFEDYEPIDIPDAPIQGYLNTTIFHK